MIVSRCAGSFVVPGSLGSECALNLGMLCMLGLEGILLLLCTLCFGVYGALLKLFWFSPPQSSSIFLQIEQFSPHPHHSAFGGVFALGRVVLVLGVQFLWAIFVAVTVLLVRGISQPFLNSKRFPDIVPALVHGVLLQTRVFSSGWGLFPGVPSVEGI